MSIFSRRPKYTRVQRKKKEMPGGLWTKCDYCGAIIYNKTLGETIKTCPKCNYHFKLSWKERIDLLFDNGAYKEFDKGMKSVDPLEFKGPKSYKDKLKEAQERTSLKEAVITGEAELGGKPIIFALTDSSFIMGSMGSVVGEKIARATEEATRKSLPLLIISGSGGGARMYEGMFSLMQMAKTSAAIGRHQEEGHLFISLLTNPTMAGIMASFASLGDIIIAEPKALIGFTGPRVIEQTIKQKLPEGFQSSEFLLEHGLIDLIVNRKDLKNRISQILDYLQ